MILPETEDQLAEAIKAAKGPLRIIGGGTRPIGKKVVGDALSTRAMTGITLYEPGAMTMVARAGTPLAEIEAELSKNNQRLAFEPMDHRGLLGTEGDPTIGGAVAANVSGPRRIQVGACRDHLLGVRYVDGTGRAIKNGGRVMKNVTGYDLVKLMAGSYGTLGVLSELSFKVLPKPDVTFAICLQDLSGRDAQKAMSMALASPYEITGAAHAPQSPSGVPMTYLRIEGFENSVTYRAEALKDLLSTFGTAHVEMDQSKVAELWQWVRDVRAFHTTSDDVWRISVKPTDGPDIAARLSASGMLYDWGGGLIWAALPAATDARALLGGFEGHATLIRASEKTKNDTAVFQPEPAALAAISAGIREKMDPRNILNPGLMG